MENFGLVEAGMELQKLRTRTKSYRVRMQLSCIEKFINEAGVLIADLNDYLDADESCKAGHFRQRISDWRSGDR